MYGGVRGCTICRRISWVSSEEFGRLSGKKYTCAACEERKRQTGTYDLPPEILREKAMKRSRNMASALFLTVAERDNWTCHLCGQHVERKDASVDHIIPVSQGGSGTLDNLKLAHWVCNKRRGTKPIAPKQGDKLHYR